MLEDNTEYGHHSKYGHVTENQTWQSEWTEYLVEEKNDCWWWQEHFWFVDICISILDELICAHY